ncbi:hypothetical protein ACFE04_004263 [Oxalis oulophora]
MESELNTILDLEAELRRRIFLVSRRLIEGIGLNRTGLKINKPPTFCYMLKADQENCGAVKQGSKKIPGCKRLEGEGGLGCKRLEAYNRALLAKQCWRLVIVSKVFKGKYFPRVSFMKVAPGKHASCIWKGLIQARDVLLKGGRWRIGEDFDNPDAAPVKVYELIEYPIQKWKETMMIKFRINGFGAMIIMNREIFYQICANPASYVRKIVSWLERQGLSTTVFVGTSSS